MSDFFNKSLKLPGFFRPTKEWDLLVVKNGQLLFVLEDKSQVGPSFGNNFNIRTEEAMGSALDLWTAYIEIDPEYCNIIEHRLDHNTLFKTSSFLRLNTSNNKINGEMTVFYRKVAHEFSALVA